VPATKVYWRLTVVANRDTQDKKRYNLWLHIRPWAVVPGTGVPVVIMVDPVQAVIKEIVGIYLWSIIDRIARDRNELRVQRHVNTDTDVWQADTDTYLGSGRNNRI